MLAPADALPLAIERADKPQSSDIIAVAILSGIGLLLSLATIIFDSPGEWFLKYYCTLC
jgi:hypothetical protein